MREEEESSLNNEEESKWFPAENTSIPESIPREEASFSSDSSDIRGHPPIQVPVNIETRGLSTPYGQVGILTNTGRSDNLILPLMGRRHMTGRDKWLYYTISNTGSLNTKLPISVNGKGCDSEYGCDPIMQGDSVYVEGYKDTFNATIYENNAFRYIPY